MAGGEVSRERGRTYWSRHWRGQLPLWLSLFVNTVIALPLALAGGIWLLTYLSVDYSPHTRIALSYGLYAALSLLFGWQLVGIWRAGKRSREQGGRWVSRWGARALALCVGLLLVWLWNLMQAGIGQLEAIANDTDAIGRIGYSLTVDGDRLVLDGSMAWSLTERVPQVLDARPGVTTVVLTSIGGNEQVGRRVADEIIARGLDTLVVESCASSCTIAFAAGRQRRLARGARLGFHATSPIFGTGGGLLIRRANQRVRAYFERIDVPAGFLDKVAATPASDIWFPTERELLDANIVTEVVE